jgi:hypothetical protein
MTGSISYSRNALICLFLGFSSDVLGFLALGWDAPVLLLAAWTLFLLCFLLGFVAWSNIRNSGGRLVGLTPAAGGMALALLCIPLSFFQAAG